VRLTYLFRPSPSLDNTVSLIKIVITELLIQSLKKDSSYFIDNCSPS